MCSIIEDADNPPEAAIIFCDPNVLTPILEPPIFILSSPPRLASNTIEPLPNFKYLPLTIALPSTNNVGTFGRSVALGLRTSSGNLGKFVPIPVAVIVPVPAIKFASST